MGFSSRRMLAGDWRQIKNFQPTEFKNPEKMGYEFMLWLDELRERAGVPMIITSSYRSPSYNRRVGGAADSAHSDEPCDSIDIGMRPRPSDPNWNYSRYMILFTAHEMGCRRFGLYDNGSMHLDRTEDRRPSPRVWRVVVGH